MADTAVLRIRVESNGINAAKTDLNALAAQSTRTENVVSRLKTVIGTVAAAIGANEVIRYADTWTNVSNKLTNVTKSGESLIDVQNRIFGISQRTNSSIEATAQLYGRLEPATRGLIGSGAELGSVVETINKAMLVSGATSAEAAGSLVQLAQGLGAGALRGEEFNSVNEAAPRLMQAIADSLGVTRGELKNYAAQGKLTSEVVINAMRSQADAIDTEFSRMNKTFEQKGVQAWNNVVKAIGTDSNLKSAVSEAGDLMVGLSDNIGTLITIGEAMAVLYGSRLVGSIVTSQAAMGALTTATNIYTLATTPAIVKTDALGMAISTTSRAAQIGTVAWAGFNSALSLVGGPLGFAMLAASAIYYCTQRTEEASQATIDYANKLDVTAAALERMTVAQRQSAEIDLEKSIAAQQSVVTSLKSEVDDLTGKWAQYQQETQAVGLAVNQNAEVHQELITKTAALETEQGKLSSMTSKLYSLQASLSSKLTETAGVLQSYGESLSTTEQIERQFADAVGNSNAQLKTRSEYVTNLSGKSIFGESALKEINAMNANASALSIQDKRLREVTQARNSYTQAGKYSEVEIGELVNAHMREYDQQQKNEAADRAASKALQGVGSATNSAADAAKQHAEEVEKQKQAINDLSVELKANQLEAAGNGREAVLLTAKHEAQQQGLGNLTNSYVSAKMALYDFQQQQVAASSIKNIASGVDVSSSTESLDSFYQQKLISEQDYVTESAALKDQWRLKLASEDTWLNDEQTKLKASFDAKLIDEQQYNTASQQLLLQWGQRRRQTLTAQQATEQTDMQRWLTNMKASTTTSTGLMSQAFGSFTENVSKGLTDAIFQTNSLSEAVTSAANSFAQSTIQALLQVMAQKVALWAIEKSIGTSAGATYASQVSGQALAGVNLAGINAYASTAAIPITGPLMAPAAMAAAIGATSPMAAAATAAASSSMLSFDGGGFTGYGARAGGVDGKGGFLAIMHPNETVTDHTKNQSPSSNSTTNNRSTIVNVNQTINTTGRIDQRTSKQIASDTARKQRMVTSRLG